jgi:hypothetical protein
MENGIMTKQRTITFSVPEELQTEFREYCRRKGFNKSILIRILITKKMDEDK